MTQAIDPTTPTSTLLAKGVVDAQMGMHLVTKRRDKVERRLDDLERVI
jgi:hypothetical protein